MMSSDDDDGEGLPPITAIERFLRNKEWDAAQSQINALPRAGYFLDAQQYYQRELERQMGKVLHAVLFDPSTSPDAVQDLLDRMPGFAPFEESRWDRSSFRTDIFDRMCRIRGYVANRPSRIASVELWKSFCRSASPAVMRIILTEYRLRAPELPNPHSVDHKDSIEYLWRIFFLDERDSDYHYPSLEPRRADRERLDLLSRVTSIEDASQDKALSILWQKTEVFLRDLAACQGYIGWYPLHFALRHKFPPAIIWFLVNVFPSAASKKDGGGCLALELVIKMTKQGAWNPHGAYGNSRAFGISFELNGYARNRPPSFAGSAPPFRYVLQAFPEAARHRIAGRLPLSIVCRADDFEARDVIALARAEPRALETRDRRTKMYPFMDAAVTKKWHRGKHEQLESVYLLLRENPNALKIGISPKKVFYQGYNTRGSSKKKSRDQKATRVAGSGHKDVDTALIHGDAADERFSATKRTRYSK